MNFNKLALALILCPFLIKAVPDQKPRTAVDKELRKAFFDHLVSKNDKHKKIVSESTNTTTLNVVYNYDSAPAVLKTVAEKLVKDAAEKKAAAAGWFGSKKLTELSAELPFEQGTITKCSLSWRGEKNDASVINCSLTEPTKSFIEGKSQNQPTKNENLKVSASTIENSLLG